MSVILSLVLTVLVFGLALVYANHAEKRTEERADEARWYSEIIGRADEQHRQWMSGDDRGLYGMYPPAGL